MKKDTSLYIYGRKPIEEALFADPKNVKMVYFKDSIKEGDLVEVRKFLSRHKIPISKVPENKLISLVGDVNTQGFVAELKAFKSTDFAESPKRIGKNPISYEALCETPYFHLESGPRYADQCPVIRRARKLREPFFCLKKGIWDTFEFNKKYHTGNR
jgi:hypothetical protein